MMVAESKAKALHPIVQAGVPRVIIGTLAAGGLFFVMAAWGGSTDFITAVVGTFFWIYAIRACAPLWNLDKQVVRYTNCRIYGEAEHGLAGGQTSYAIPYSEIEGIKQSWLATDLKLRGVKKPLRLYLIDDITAIEDRVAAIHDYGDNPDVLREMDVVPVFEGIRLDRGGDSSIGGSSGKALLTALVLGGLGLFVIVPPALEVRARYGGSDDACVTLGRVYRDNVDEGLQALLERYDQDPSRQINRVLASKIVGVAARDVFDDTSFAHEPYWRCILGVTLHGMSPSITHNIMADRMEGMAQSLFGG